MQHLPAEAFRQISFAAGYPPLRRGTILEFKRHCDDTEVAAIVMSVDLRASSFVDVQVGNHNAEVIRCFSEHSIFLCVRFFAFQLQHRLALPRWCAKETLVV